MPRHDRWNRNNRPRRGRSQAPSRRFRSASAHTTPQDDPRRQRTQPPAEPITNAQNAVGGVEDCPEIVTQVCRDDQEPRHGREEQTPRMSVSTEPEHWTRSDRCSRPGTAQRSRTYGKLTENWLDPEEADQRQRPEEVMVWRRVQWEWPTYGKRTSRPERLPRCPPRRRSAWKPTLKRGNSEAATARITTTTANSLSACIVTSAALVRNV